MPLTISLPAFVPRVAYVEAKTTGSVLSKVKCFQAVALAQFLPPSRCMNIFPGLHYKSEPAYCQKEATNSRPEFWKMKNKQLMELNKTKIRFPVRQSKSYQGSPDQFRYKHC